MTHGAKSINSACSVYFATYLDQGIVFHIQAPFSPTAHSHMHTTHDFTVPHLRAHSSELTSFCFSLVPLNLAPSHCPSGSILNKLWQTWTHFPHWTFRMPSPPPSPPSSSLSVPSQLSLPVLVLLICKLCRAQGSAFALSSSLLILILLGISSSPETPMPCTSPEYSCSNYIWNLHLMPKSHIKANRDKTELPFLPIPVFTLVSCHLNRGNSVF
jgi:hypothetical protein